MDPDPRLPELFGEASELEGEALAAWLAALREKDPRLAGEVEQLLAASPAGGRRFESPAWRRLPADVEDGAPPPDRIGPYRILREIGRGGMGRVFLAEEVSEEFRRQVALKVIDRPGAGPDTVRRFRDEVRILAALEHPGIARFFDGGRAPDGTWFLALEYVEGEDLLTFVRGRRLDLRARVELFLQVLDAVDFAHRRLVVHRDLKPTNVLVDPEGRTKLLDFGISKVVDPGSEEDATLTQARAFTPDYASPEQLRGARATVATDVYSLGIMLYELLAGRRPFRRKEPDFDLASLARDPEPPSTAVRDTAPPSVAAADETTAPIGWRDLTGDLDAITLKALRAEPEKRYPSVEALAGDLRRWLAGRPVEARRGGRRYRVGKFIRRHRAPVAFAALAALALFAGAVGIVVESRRAARAAAIAKEQRDFALRQLSRAEAINDLNAFLLSDAAAGGKPFTTDDLLARAERIVEKQRGGRKETRADVLFAIGRQYHTQDEQGKARELLARAWELTKHSPDRATRARVACALAAAVADGGEFERAARLLREGLELPDEPQFALPRVFCHLRASGIARDAGDGDEAVRHALAARSRMRESGQGSELLELTVAMDVAESYRLADRRREADAAFAQAWARLEAMGRGETEKAGTLLNNWALVVRSLGRPKAAERLFRQAIDVTSSGGPEQGVSPMLLNNYGRTLLELGRAREALEYSERAYRRAKVSGSLVVITQALFLRALLHLTLGEPDRAADVLAELEPRVSRLPAGHPGRAVLESLNGLLAEARGDAAAAAAAHDRAVAQAEGHDTEAILFLRRSAFHLENGRPEDARKDAEKALAVEQKSVGPGSSSSRVGVAYLALARALRAGGRANEARAASAMAQTHLEASLGADHPDTLAARELAILSP